MKIKKNWEVEDAVSGLKIKVIEGKFENILNITHISKPISNNRDFFFDKKDGHCTGTGSAVGCGKKNEGEGVEEDVKIPPAKPKKKGGIKNAKKTK